MCKATCQEAPQDHDTLGVQWSTKLNFALDVSDAALPHMHPRRNSVRAAEGKVAQLENGKAVDLANLLALGADKNDLSGNTFMRPIAHSVRALDALINGALNIFFGDLGPPCLAGSEVGLTDDVGDAADLDRKLVAVIGEPRALLNQPRNGCRACMAQFVFDND